MNSIGDQDIRKLLTEIIESTSNRGTILERHAQTIMVGLVTIGIVFVSTSISNQNAEIKVLQAQNNNLHSEMKDLKELVRLGRNNYITRGEYLSHVQENERRIRALESKLNATPQDKR